MSVVTNFSKAAIARSQFNIPILVLRQVAEHSKFIKSNIDQDVIDLSFNQVPLAA